ncbi:hypothetical protein GX51_06551 [Blastomyces parvus]|uniref:Uncharacterized protein n=1 Tax=Blastomyces parvus TaxID=2060905 RepID=A0A2B7WQI1_9EURO|nr:hypothetical protein GX51_06551 [Blastomyces parvus]
MHKRQLHESIAREVELQRFIRSNPVHSFHQRAEAWGAGEYRSERSPHTTRPLADFTGARIDVRALSIGKQAPHKWVKSKEKVSFSAQRTTLTGHSSRRSVRFASTMQ